VLQMANLTNAALAKLVAAGVVLVPFDSSNLDQAIAVSWAGGTEAGGYELPDALSRYRYNHRLAQPIHTCTDEVWV